MAAKWNNNIGGIGRWTIVNAAGEIVWASITPWGREEAGRLLRGLFGRGL